VRVAVIQSPWLSIIILNLSPEKPLPPLTNIESSSTGISKAFASMIVKKSNVSLLTPEPVILSP